MGVLKFMNLPFWLGFLFITGGLASDEGIHSSDYDENFNYCYDGTPALNAEEDFQIRVDNPTKENAFKNTIQTLCIEQFTPRANRYHRCAESLTTTDAERAKYDMKYAQFYLDFCNARDPKEFLCHVFPKVAVTGFSAANYKDVCSLALDMNKFYSELYASCPSKFDVTTYVEKLLMENRKQLGEFKTLEQCLEENKPTPAPDEEKFYDCVGQCVLDSGHERSKRFPRFASISIDAIPDVSAVQKMFPNIPNVHQQFVQPVAPLSQRRDFTNWCQKVTHSDIFSKCSDRCASHHPELATARIHATQFITTMCDGQHDEEFTNFTKCFDQSLSFQAFVAKLMKTPPLAACPFAMELHKYFTAETCAVEKEVIEIIVDEFVLQFSRMQKTFEFKQIHLCLKEAAPSEPV
uniref:Uncharacterized protein n=1 Tax=Panagrolaimus sp. JU765 TaxID=591449 RepID=A0AC34Q7X3_9BILA